MDSIREKVRNFLLSHQDENEWNDSDNIFQLGYIDSLFSLQLVIFVEKEFSITVDNMDLDIENFSSVNRITDFIMTKLAMKEEKV